MAIFKCCKETSQLVTLLADRPSSWQDRLAMRIHLLVCINCARFARQMRMIREWLRSEEGGGELSGPARARIAARLNGAAQEPEKL
ncbi:MAG TPA: zf-HC2 domain-containing protein [Thiobacillaceae bacterium]|nr:zf-HC2 domain-containing protein [Thiobacillaceae bacterium]